MNKELKTKKTKTSGFTLLLSLLVVSILLSVGMGVFNSTTKELKLSGMGRESQIAFYAADAGIECFFFWEIKHPDLADTAFAYYDNGSNPTIKCAGNDIVISALSDGPYNLTLNLGNNSCAKVNITKKTIGSSVETTVESKGYNTACDFTSPFKVERAIQLVSTKQEGEGSYLPPEAPTNIVANSNSFHKINLSWDNSLGADSYTVYRSDDNDNFTAVVSEITGQNYTDGGLDKNTTYYYYVTALNNYGESDPSEIVNVKTNDTTAVTFTYNGSSQTWSVPSGVTEILISTYGAQGSSGGGKGGYVKAIFNVNPNDLLYVYVGGAGTNALCIASAMGYGGFNGGENSGLNTDGIYGCPGNGGGGASDVRQNGMVLGNRIIVAGGGGGFAPGVGGGLGGGTNGGDAVVTNSQYSGGGAGGIVGNMSSGGSGGTGGFNGNPGNNGAIGIGGSGGSNNDDKGGTGGGGGGGYYGGGGGGGGGDCNGSCTANDDNGHAGGGGGGGSSYTSGFYSAYQNGVNTGNGLIIIEY